MDFRTIPAAVLLGLIVCFSCGKKEPVKISTPSGSDTVKNIYIVGDTALLSSVTRPLYWRNGTLTRLGDGYIGRAGGVSVVGNDIYMATDTAVLPLGPTHFTIIWKNGNRILRYAGGLAASTVSGTDIYTAGYILNAAGNGQIAAYWKNGNAVYCGEGSGISISVSGSDVYIAGLYRNSVVYWKNGSLVSLPNNTLSYGTVSITVSGTDVYVASTTANTIGLPVATYWKNGVPTFLTSGSSNTVASAVTVSGTDLYVAGYVGGLLNPVATYWKNGVAVSLGSGMANAIVVSGQDVYVCGTSGNDAVYWKNGVKTILGKGYASTMALQK